MPVAGQLARGDLAVEGDPDRALLEGLGGGERGGPEQRQGGRMQMRPSSLTPLLARLLFLLACFFFALEHGLTTVGFSTSPSLFCPTIRAVPAKPLQALSELTSRPCLPPLEGQAELAHRGIGKRVVGGAHAAVLGVDAADHLDAHASARELGDQVGQFVAGGAQVDRAFQGLVQQRRNRPGLAVDRAGGAFAGRALRFAADRVDVLLSEEQRGRQGDLGGADVGVAGLRRDGRRQARVLAALGAALQAQFELRA